MTTEKLIEVSLEATLVQRIEKVAEREGKSRSALIQEACESYLTGKSADDALDEAYAAGYKAAPEEPLTSEIQLAVLADVVAEDSW